MERDERSEIQRTTARAAELVLVQAGEQYGRYEREGRHAQVRAITERGARSVMSQVRLERLQRRLEHVIEVLGPERLVREPGGQAQRMHATHAEREPADDHLEQEPERVGERRGRWRPDHGEVARAFDGRALENGGHQPVAIAEVVAQRGRTYVRRTRELAKARLRATRLHEALAGLDHERVALGVEVRIADTRGSPARRRTVLDVAAAIPHLFRMSSVTQNESTARDALFMGFAGQWTPVDLASRVKRGRTLATRLAGEKVVLFRDTSGGLGALIDRCPHRGVELSRGRVTERGTLECPFHGWEIEKDGGCARVPWCELSAEKRAGLSATALPVREAGGLVWVFTGTDARGTEIDLPEALADDAAWSRFFLVEDWSTHWTRAMENMLDYPHLPFVHRGSIGRGLRAPAAGQSSLELSTERTGFGMRIAAKIDGRSSGAGLEWRRPNGMVLVLDQGARRMRQHVYCVPVDERTTRMILVTTRDFGLYNPLMWFFDQFNRVILHEDRAVVESSDPPAVPRPRFEKSVMTDAPTLAFRRWYFDALVDGKRADVPLASLVRSRGGDESVVGPTELAS